MHQNKLLLKIESSREKLKSSFPVDPRADVEILFRSHKYRLQMAHLRLYSDYFKNACFEGATLRVKQNFKEKHFEQILSLLYGYSIQIDNFEIDSYYTIARFLEIECLVEQMRRAILKNLGNYSVFSIIKIASKYSDQELFEACCECLAREEYQQLKYQKSQFFNLDLSLVRVIIKSHKKFKNETNKGLNYIDIDNLLKQYSMLNELDEDKYLELKFQLFDLNTLSSKEYKHIFLDEIKRDYGRVSSDEGNQHSIMFQSTVSTNLKNNTTNQLKLEMENTFQTKRNNELEIKNKTLQGQLKKVKHDKAQTQKTYNSLEGEIQKLKHELQKRDHHSEHQKTMIKKFEQMFGVMENQLQKKTDQIDCLTEQFQTFKVTCKNPQSINVQNNIFVQSQFLPAHLINEMMMPPNSNQPFSTKPAAKSPTKTANTSLPSPTKKSAKRPKYEEMDDEELQQVYQDRMLFDAEPISIQKKQIPLLSDFVCSKGFSRKKFNLIYRRSKKYDAVGDSEVIKERNPLLVLVNTAFHEQLGGYISRSIPKNENSVSDPQAFIFSLTKDKKYKISPAKEGRAVIVKDSYMLCFANDLLISNDCLNTASFCFWPNCYTFGENIENGSPSFLTGAKEFLINDMEIYEVLEGEMQMIV